MSKTPSAEHHAERDDYNPELRNYRQTVWPDFALAMLVAQFPRLALRGLTESLY